MHATPFTDRTLRNAFFSSLDASDELPETVSIAGSTPFGHTDLTRFIRGIGISVVSTSPNTEVLIIGRDGWSPDRLKDLLDHRAGRTLKVYSQEMFLVFAASRHDPFNDSREVLERYGRGHAALEYLSDVGFDWPTTHVVPGHGTVSDEDWPDESPLARLGYGVGRKGPPTHRRRELLRTAYTSDLPRVQSVQYMEKWGIPRSSERLYQIATHLASMCRNFKGRSDSDYGAAVRDYENDLAWLKEEFYRGRYTFKWPSTFVG